MANFTCQNCGAVSDVADRKPRYLAIAYDCDCGCINWPWTITSDGRPVSNRKSLVREILGVDLGQVVINTCGNKRCLRADHMLILPKVDIFKYFDAYSKTARGEQHGHAVLTDEQVLEIRRLHSAGCGAYYIAKQFGVSGKCIYQVIDGTTWKHLLT